MYKVQKRVFSQMGRDSFGYPTGPKQWSEWETIIEFEDRDRAIAVADLLQNCPSITTMKVDPNREFRMSDL